MKVRQLAPTLSGIREDHRARYYFAVSQAQNFGIKYVTDIGCGCGYGAYIMAKAGLRVFAFDKDAETIEYARQHYSHPNILYTVLSLEQVNDQWSESPDRLITAFEVIEHSAHAPETLTRLYANHRLIVGSVPNENTVPYNPTRVNPEHYRHYTPEEIVKEIEACGWRVSYLGSQTGKHGNGAQVIPSTYPAGRTLIFRGER